MDCQYCTPVREATFLLLAGTDLLCTPGQWAVCDRHLPVLRQALMFTHDECTPSHQYMAGLVTDLETGEETRWVREGIGEYTVDHLMRFLEPAQVSCEGCGRLCTGSEEANRCQESHARMEAAKLGAARERAEKQLREMEGTRETVARVERWLRRPGKGA